MLAASTRPRQAEGVLMQEVAGSTILLKPGSGQYYALEEVSREIWDACDGSRSVAEIIARMQAEYDAEPSEIEADVLALLGELVDEHLVETDR